MINQKQKNVLLLALTAGEILMKSGSEIYRVEDTITKICKAFHIPYVEVFATTTGIFLSIDSGEDAYPYTLVRRIKGGSIDLDKISKINSFSRELVGSDASIEEDIGCLNTVRDQPSYPLPVQMFGAALIASFFTRMLGGSWIDFGCALFSGILTYGFALLLNRVQLNSNIRIFFACALTAFLSILAVVPGPGSNLNAIIVGGLMIFLPGLALTNAVRDSLAGDLLAGSARALEAGLAAASTAAGVGMALAVWRIMGGVF